MYGFDSGVAAACPLSLPVLVAAVTVVGESLRNPQPRISFLARADTRRYTSVKRKNSAELLNLALGPLLGGVFLGDTLLPAVKIDQWQTSRPPG
jgi:hypothetical protein